jgi:hypothetical protein
MTEPLALLKSLIDHLEWVESNGQSSTPIDEILPVLREIQHWPGTRTPVPFPPRAKLKVIK